MNTLIEVVLIVATLGLTYIFAFKIARAAGDEYPAKVRTPGIIGALASLISGGIALLYLLGFFAPTLPFQIVLSIGLVAIVGSLAVIGAQL
jgi:hypothetical protein